MIKLIRAITSAIQAELKLQAELAKKYPFGYCDKALIDENARFYRHNHSIAMYLKVPNVDMYPFGEMPHTPVKEYSGAYGCFSYDKDKIESVNIVCEHSVNHVYAHNLEEAKDMILENENKDKYHEGSWLLTELVEYIPRYGSKAKDYILLYR